LNFPIPVIYLAQTPDENYEVIDGVQRLTSVFNYFGKKFRLSDCKILQELNGKFFRDLTSRDQKRLEDATIRSFELSPKTPKDRFFIIFERLNTGGVQLNEMEIRNCIFAGQLNDLIKNLTDDENFKNCINKSNIQIRMEDRALILRFLAFYTKSYLGPTKVLKGFLNDFFEDYRNPPEDRLKEFEKAFRGAMRSSYTVF
jgi:uncharacterized protein with ParB-like and HNH nuclease domain